MSKTKRSLIFGSDSFVCVRKTSDFMTLTIDFLGNLQSTVLLVSSAPSEVSLPCMTPSSAALETLFSAQNILRNTTLLRFPRKSDMIAAVLRRNYPYKKVIGAMPPNVFTGGVKNIGETSMMPITMETYKKVCSHQNDADVERCLAQQ